MRVRGPGPWLAVASTAMLGLAYASRATTALWAQEVPVDSTRVIELLEEATAAYGRASETLRADSAFRATLAELANEWGVAWNPASVPVPSPPAEVIDSLVERDELPAALAYEPYPPFSSAYHVRVDVTRAVLEGLARRGRIERTLSLADSLGQLGIGIWTVRRIVQADSIEWRRVTDRMARYVRREASDGTDVPYQLGSINYVRAEHDFAAAWRRAGEWQPDSLLMWRVDILDQAYEQELPEADSLFLDTYERARQVPDSAAREDLLLDLEWICDLGDRIDCTRLGFPVSDETPDRRRRVADDLRRALRRGDFTAADQLGEELADLASPVEHATTVAGGLVLARWTCVSMLRCSRAYDSLLTVTLPALDRVASSTDEGSAADSLNVDLAGLWAGRDIGRARAAVERTVAASAKERALGELAARAYDWNREAALEAYADAGGSARHGLKQDFVHYMRWGETQRAEEVMDLMPSGDARLDARLEWAQLTWSVGRRAEGRELAVRALDAWEPSARQLTRSRRTLDRFRGIGVLDDVIAWARARQDPDERAAALVTVIGNLTTR